MKKKWIEYSTENGEIWQLFVDADYSEKEEDRISKNGNIAVMRRQMGTTDQVCITIIPSARIIDNVKKQIGRDRLYYLKLSLLNGDDWYCISDKAHAKEDIIKMSNLFIGLNKQQAKRVWEAKKLGNVSTDRLER